MLFKIAQPDPSVPMSEDRAHSLSLLADNILKVVIAALVGILTWIGSGLQDKLGKVETDVASMKVQMAEIKTEMKYLSQKGGNP